MQIKKQKLWVGIDVGMKSFHAALDFPLLFDNQEELSVADLPDREFKAWTIYQLAKPSRSAALK